MGILKSQTCVPIKILSAVARPVPGAQSAGKQEFATFGPKQTPNSLAQRNTRPLQAKIIHFWRLLLPEWLYDFLFSRS